MLWLQNLVLKFIYSEKATKILRNLHLFLTGTSTSQKKVEISQKFCGLLRIYELKVSKSVNEIELINQTLLTPTTAESSVLIWIEFNDWNVQTHQIKSRLFNLLILFHPQKRCEITIFKLRCQFFQKTDEKFSLISPLSSKKRANQIKAIYYVE